MYPVGDLDRHEVSAERLRLGVDGILFMSGQVSNCWTGWHKP